jgi:hypothetical protein
LAALMPLRESVRRLLEPTFSAVCAARRGLLRAWELNFAARLPIQGAATRPSRSVIAICNSGSRRTRGRRAPPPRARINLSGPRRTRAVVSRVTLGGDAHPAERAPQLALPTRALGPQSGTQPPRPARASCCGRSRFWRGKKMQQRLPERGTGERSGEPDPKPGTKRAERSAVRGRYQRSRPALTAMSA